MRGYRADTAFDGDRELPGGALVLVDDGLVDDVVLGVAPRQHTTPVVRFGLN